MQINQALPDDTLDNCDEEPIHILGRIQSHGFLLVCRRADYQIVQISQNAADYTGISTELLLQSNLADLLDAETYKKLQDAVQNDLPQSAPVWSLLIDDVQAGGQGVPWNLIAHTAQDIAPDLLLIEFEPMADKTALHKYYQWPEQILQLALSGNSTKDMFERSAKRIKELTGFDRVMVYRFDEEWNGEVIAEAKNEDLESFLGLHYPASDIPAQARKLYTRNLIRYIADTTSTASTLHPSLTPRDEGKATALDLSDSALRAVSEYHIEYMLNMGLKSSMSITILCNNELWGLVVCHSYSAKFVDYNTRSICKFISTLLSSFIETKLAALDNDYMAQLAAANESLMTKIVEADRWLEGLTDEATTLLKIANASGAAIYLDGEVVTLGVTPSAVQITRIAQWLEDHYKDRLFVTDRLPRLVESLKKEGKAIAKNESNEQPSNLSADEFAKAISDVAGILAIQLSPAAPDAIIWFRPEVLQNVDWGGKPVKERTVTEEGVRFSPRKSFEKWSQTVEGQSLPWKPEEVKAAQRLSGNIQSVIVSHTLKIEQINARLQRANDELDAFSYTVAHDLTSPLRHIDSYIEILYEEYQGQLDEQALGILETVLQSTSKMKQLVNDLLAYSRISRTKRIYNHFAPQALIDEALESLLDAHDGLQITVQARPLPDLYGDHPLIQQVFINLLDNAIKYSSKKAAPLIEIDGYEDEEMVTIYIKDNGVGFDMRYVDKVFNVFSRLHSDDEFEGTGIGLAIVARIIDSHNGKIWIEGIPNDGTTIYFSLPKFLGEIL